MRNVSVFVCKNVLFCCVSRSVPFRTVCWQAVSSYLLKAFATVSAQQAPGTHEPRQPVPRLVLRTSCRWENFLIKPSSSPSVWPHNPATRFRPPSATVVSAEPFSHRTGTLRCLQKEMATCRHWSVSLWRDPDDVSHCWILSPDKTEWWLISATLCGWGRCFVADKLW